MADERTILQRRVPKVDMAAISVSDNELDRAYLIPDYDLHLATNFATAKPPNGRPYWQGQDVAKKFADDRKGTFLHLHHPYPVKTALPQLQMVNDTGKKIFAYINGERTGNDVYRLLLSEYRRPYGTLKDAIYGFMRQMVQMGQVFLSATPRPMTVRTTGSDSYIFPQHMSIEVTANCNIKCIHCYGTFEQSRFDAIAADDLLRTLERLKEKGLSSVELTGGECTMHLEFARILQWCAENLSMVAVLTNGVSLKEEHFDVLGRYPHNIVLQICINGNQEYHDRFTKAHNLYKRSMRAMNRIARLGLLIRAPMNCTFENYLQIEETCQTVLNNGAHTFMTNWVNPNVGRAQDHNVVKGQVLSEELRRTLDPEFLRQLDSSHRGPCNHIQSGLNCFQRAEIMQWWVQTMRGLVKRYSPSAVQFEVNEATLAMTKWEGSCGAGRRSFYMASNGRIGICPMSVESGIPGFGTLSTDGNMEAIVNSEFAKHFSTLPAPNPNDCAECPHELEHRGCLLHGIMQYMKTPATCKWGQKHNIQKLIDTGFHTLTKKADGSYELPELTHCGTGCGSASGEGSQSELVELQMTRLRTC